MSEFTPVTVLRFLGLFLPAMIIILQLLPNPDDEISPAKLKGESLVKTVLAIGVVFSAAGMVATMELLLVNSTTDLTSVALAFLLIGLGGFILLMWKYWKYYKTRFEIAGE